MRKVLVASAILLASVVTKQAGAQTLPAGIVIVNDASAGTVLNNVVLTVSSSQPQTVGATPSTTSASFNEGLNLLEDQSGLAGAVGYWVTPTNSTPLTLSIASGGGQILVTNESGASQSYFIRASVFNEEGTVVNAEGSIVTIPNGQQAFISIPAISNSYNSTTYLQDNATYGIPTPIGIALIQN